MERTEAACFPSALVGTHNIERGDEEATIVMATDSQQRNISIMLSSPQMNLAKAANPTGKKLFCVSNL